MPQITTQHLFAYHLKPLNFQGEQILPINRLQQLHPELAESALQKYQGREKLINRIVYDPKISLNNFMGDKTLLWTDVSFSSMIDPNLIFQELKQLGLMKKDAKRQAFKIPLNRFSAKTIVWLGQKNMTNPCRLPQDDCFDLETAYKMINTETLPKEAINYFIECKNSATRPLMFVHMPHILTPDPIDVSNCQEIGVF